MTTAYDVDKDRATNVEMDTSIAIDPNHHSGGTSSQVETASMQVVYSKCTGMTTERYASRGTMDASNSLNLLPMLLNPRA